MKLLLIKHAKAFSKSSVNDFYRRLTWEAMSDIR